ncbi:MAG: transposase, partial [Planctomycetes bacterium]|nr:transposase [Planctomycetota bacterium]
MEDARGGRERGPLRQGGEGRRHGAPLGRLPRGDARERWQLLAAHHRRGRRGPDGQAPSGTLRQHQRLDPARGVREPVLRHGHGHRHHGGGPDQRVEGHRGGLGAVQRRGLERLGRARVAQRGQQRHLAPRREVCAAVRRILVRAVSGYYERRARRLGKPRPRAGAVAFVQRFDSPLRLNVHFHVLWTDGVFAHEPGRGRAEFCEHGELSDADVGRLVRAIR